MRKRILADLSILITLGGEGKVKTETIRTLEQLIRAENIPVTTSTVWWEALKTFQSHCDFPRLREFSTLFRSIFPEIIRVGAADLERAVELSELSGITLECALQVAVARDREIRKIVSLENEYEMIPDIEWIYPEHFR